MSDTPTVPTTEPTQGGTTNPEPNTTPEISVEQVKAFLDTADGKALLQPKLDSFFSKGLETWKANTLPNVIEEELAKRNPDETPEQKRIRELEEKLTAQERSAYKAELRSKTVSELTAKGLPTELASMFDFDSEEVMRETVGNLEQVLTGHLSKAIEAKLKESGKTPTGKQSNGTDPSVMTKEKLLNMTTTESTAFFNENPELFRKLMSQ